MPQSALRALDQSYLMGMGQGPAPERVPKTRGQTTADVLGAASIPMSAVPIAGDITGILADAAMYAAYPEERTMGNYAMSAAGILPFVPGVSALRALRDAPSVSLMDDGKGKALIMADGKQAGIIEYEINDGAVQIKGSEVNPSRSGIGTEAYKQFINSKMDEGFSVGSDNIVSQQAEGLYQKLSSQGYEIAENPNNRRIYPGSLTSVSRDSMRSQRLAHPTEYRDGAIQLAPGFVLRGDPVYQITRRPQDALLPSPLEGTLDMSTAARMQRAVEQVYTPDLYHGTAADVSEFNPLQFGGSVTKARSAKLGTWLVDNPTVAGGYARLAAEDVPVQKLLDQSMRAERLGNFDEAERLNRLAENLELGGELRGGGGQNIMPLRARGNFLERDAEGATMSDLDDSQLTDWAEEAKAKGFDGLKINNFSDNADYGQYIPATHYLIFDPANIRSTNAAFDPAKRGSANLMAGAAGATIGLSALRNIQRDEEPKPD